MSDVEAEITAGKTYAPPSTLTLIKVLSNLPGAKSPLPFTYETLPADLKGKLFEAHQHGDSIDEEEIVYREADVLSIINYIFESELKKDGT